MPTGFALIIDFIKRMGVRFMEDEAIGLAAQLSYFFLLSLFPFLIFMVTLLGYLPIDQDDVLGLIREYAPGETMNLIEDNLSSILETQNGSLLSFGIIGTIWVASNGINAIIRALNRAYDVKENRPFIKARGMAILLTVGMLFVIFIALLLPVFGKAIGLFVFSHFGLSHSFLTVWEAIRWIFSFLVLIIAFASIYYLAPNKRLHIREVLIGSIFATIGWQLVSFAFSYYVSHVSDYSATYGSLGGVIVLMVWFYLSGLILIIGGELNAVLSYYREKNNYV